uniref:Uncharacterized protein n=1 Tax=Arundo donax TaxID=35708 RepID=A0A0A9AAS4_ARUDO
MEAALELRARAPRAAAVPGGRGNARRLHPQLRQSCAGDDTSSSSASLLLSGTGDLGTISRAKLLSLNRHRSDDIEPGASSVRFFRCFDISGLKRCVLAGLSKNLNTNTQWR